MDGMHGQTDHKEKYPITFGKLMSFQGKLMFTITQ